MTITPPSRTSKTEAIQIRRGLYIYKQPKARGRGSPYWHARAYVPLGGRNNHTRTTKTTDIRVAIEKAEEFWVDLHIQKRFGAGTLPDLGGRVQVATHRFDKVADDWLDFKYREAGDDRRKRRRHKDYKQVLLAGNGLAAFFGKRSIESITTAMIRDYLQFATSNSKSGSLAPGTKKAHLAALRQILSYAQERQLIGSVPPMPKVQQVDNPRPWFPPEQYRELRKAAFKRRMRARAEDSEAAAIWEELWDFIVFIVNSCLRPSEWTGLQQKHIKIVEGENPHLRIDLKEGKTKPRVVVTMPGAIHAYRRIQARGGADPEAYIFLNQYANRETALAVMRKAFNDLVHEHDLALDAFGKKRCIYSLRHTAIMLRLIEGVNAYDLAKNAGTGVKQIERFYGSHLEPSMRIAELQKSKKRPPNKAANSACNRLGRKNSDLEATSSTKIGLQRLGDWVRSMPRP